MKQISSAEYGLYGVILVALFSFGAVPHWSYLSISALVFIACCFSPAIVSDYPKIHRLAIVSAAALFCWVSYQSVFLSINTQYSVYQLIKWFAGAGIFLLCHKLSRDALFRVLLFLVFMVCIVLAYGLYELFSGNEQILWEAKTAHNGFLTATYRNRNHFSGLLEMTSGVLLGFIFRFFDKKKPALGILFILIFIVFLFAIVMAGSRTGLACWFFMLLVFFFFLLLTNKSKGAAISLLIVSVLTVLIAVYFGWEVFARRIEALSLDIETWEGRVTVWAEIIRMIPDFFWTGAGLGNFGYVYPVYQSPDIVYRWVHAHQDYLELMIELGIPGMALLILTFLGIFLTLLNNLNDKDYASSVLSAGCVAGCLGLMAHGLADFNFAIPANHFIFILILGAGCRVLQFQKRRLLVKKDYRGNK